MRLPPPPLLLVVLLVLGGIVTHDASASGRRQLLARFEAIEARLDSASAPLPFAVDTNNGDGDARGDVFAVFDHDFELLARALSAASNWCDIAPLHLNVKSCTTRKEAGKTFLTLYSGRKVYERPEDVYALNYEFRIAEAEADYFRVVLTADEGPLDTRDYVLELEATSIGSGASFVHLSYAYRYGFGMRVALAGYLATFGSAKVGFSVVGADAMGNPIYVDGFEGLIERNSVRYQLAIQAYLDTLGFPEGQRFERRIARWFELTERYRRQLFELDQEEYLQTKRREHSDQLRLQQALTAETRRH